MKKNEITILLQGKFSTRNAM